MISLIVEGQSEVVGLPVLIRRLLHDCQAYEVGVHRPFRVQRSKVVKPRELEHAIATVLRKRGETSGILLVLDADDDPADALETELRNRGRTVSPVPFEAVVVKHEIEALFLAAKPSLRGVRGIRETAAIPGEGPESIRDAAGRLSQNMEGRKYLKVDDLPAFADAVDISMGVANSPSFRRLQQAVTLLAGRTK